MNNRDWDVVGGDGSKPVEGEQTLPEELQPKEKTSGKEVPHGETLEALQGED